MDIVQSVKIERQTFLFSLVVIAVLAIVAYLPTLSQPLISDDYPNIAMARIYGPPTGWGQMLSDDVNRVRATSWITIYLVEQVAGLSATAFYSFSILLHILNCWLIFLFGKWNMIGYKVSMLAAVFFAVHEGHQEAVMWYSACNELLQFLFGVGSIYFLATSLDRPKERRWYAAALASFLLTLLSKESAVIFVPLFALVMLAKGIEVRKFVLLLPLIVLALLDAMLIYNSRVSSFRFSDGSFELSAPFWITWTKSFSALLWPWGLAALVYLILKRRSMPLICYSLLWMAISLIPYIFLTYMYRVPSRQTYLAGAGVAILVGAALYSVWELCAKKRRWVPATIMIVMVLHNVGYLWLKKRPQFLERARPTEELIDFARQHDGTLYIECFPLPQLHGDKTIEVALGKPAGTLVWDKELVSSAPPDRIFCSRTK